MNRITDIWRNGCTLEKLMIIWFTPHKTTTFTKWMFFHKRFVMASAAFKYGPHQQRRPLPSLLSDSYSLVCVCMCMYDCNRSWLWALLVTGALARVNQKRKDPVFNINDLGTQNNNYSDYSFNRKFMWRRKDFPEGSGSVLGSQVLSKGAVKPWKLK